jgi:RHS repeat-associated protein
MPILKKRLGATMKRFQGAIIVGFLIFFNWSIVFGGTLALEGDPASFVKNVSVIHGSYVEAETDATIQGPDTLAITRFYNSQNKLNETNLGGWSLFPHCYLFVKKDPQGAEYTTAEGKYEFTFIYAATERGDSLCYFAWHNTTNPKTRTFFEFDIENCRGLANNARGDINAWTNQKNNKLNYFSETQEVELLPSCGGKRTYVRTSNEGCFRLKQEVLPSGNKIFYNYDKENRPIFIEIKNSTEKKTISWIKLTYENGVEITTSDLRIITYHFTKNNAGDNLLSEVVRSGKPPVKYQYEIRGKSALLTKKDLPEGRFIIIDYEKETNRVHSVSQPLEVDQILCTTFNYSVDSEGNGYTEVKGPENRQQVYRYNDQYQLTVREDYLSGSLYRVHRKTWGKEADSWNLVSSSVEDAGRNVLYFKLLTYSTSGNLLEEKEYGNLTGAKESPVLLNEVGEPASNQEGHIRKYAYSEYEQFYQVELQDAKEDILKLLYKPRTNILLAKIFMEKGRWEVKIKKREIFEYNEDGVLIRAVEDDGCTMELKSRYPWVTKRYITTIAPKQDLPHFGEPEIIEKKYLNPERDKEILIKKIINHFDARGFVELQDFFDSEDRLRYSIKKTYNDDGLLTYETDPEGKITTYDYDIYHNLKEESHLPKGITYRYDYNLNNLRIRTVVQGINGESYETSVKYDGNENILSSLDNKGHEILYQNDDLGRRISASYPSFTVEGNTAIQPVNTYEYDLFDNAIVITDSQQRVTRKSYTVRGQPTLIQYPDGTEELFKYDTEGSLHRHRDRDGTTRVIEYDYLGRISHIQRYPRGSTATEVGSTNIYRDYDAFHLISETNEKGYKTNYIYNMAGRLHTQTKVKEKIDYRYDPLGRLTTLMKWKTDDTYTLERREYNLLNQVLEECTEDQKGTILLKKKFSYDTAGRLKQIIGYPNNQESVLVQYEYDGFDRVSEITNGLGLSTKISYDDTYVNSFGQQVLKTAYLDPLGNRTEEIFDAYNRPVFVSRSNTKGDQLHQKEIWYDTLGNKTLEKYARIPQGDNLNSYNVRYKYEKKELLTSIVQAEGSSEELTTTFDYNSYQDLISQSYPQNKDPIIYKYDGLGYLKSLTFKEMKASTPTTYEFTLDRGGYLTDLLLPWHSITYDYNEYDRLISEEIVNRETNKKYLIRYNYDQQGAITSLILPDESSIHYTYQGPFVVEITRRSKEKADLYKHRLVSYDLMGNILEEILPFHGGARKHTWDGLGRRTSISTDFFKDRIAENGYDLLSRVKQREITVGSSKTTIDYDYTDLSQLAYEKGVFDHRYTYDSLDNCLSQDQAVCKNNAANQLKEAGGKAYDFDLNGNLISQKSGDTGFIYEYNPLNQLTVIKDPKGNTIYFTYDPQGKRLTKKVETKDKQVKIFRYFYLGNTELGCLDENGTISELRVPLNPNEPEKSTFIGFEFKKNLYVPIYDLQGNVACLINAKQRKIVETYKYSAFGEEHILNDKGETLSTSAVGNPWRFFGKRIDLETGLIYFGKRYYDPSIRKWIIPDPAGPIDGPNVYAFVRNNPLLWTDYSGLAAEISASQDKEFLTYFKGEYEPHCACESHRKCKRGGDIGNALGGSLLGAVKFGFSRCEDLVQMFGTMAMDDFIQETFPPAQGEAIKEIEQNLWVENEQFARELVINNIDFDPLSRTAQRFEMGTYYGLVAADLIRPNLKNIKSIFSLTEAASIAKELRFTKSNLKLGRQVHKNYKIGLADEINTFKEYYLPSRKRIDFLDVTNGIIYELKPFNPRAIKLGQKQLDIYVEELKTIPRYKDIEWKKILETYQIP